MRYVLIQKEGMKGLYPYGIRNKGGLILFFKKVEYYQNQDERFKSETKEMDDTAMKILKSLNS